MMKPVSALLAILLLAGCATDTDPNSPTARTNARKAEVSASVDDIPYWFTNPPKDQVSLYAPGAATSSDMQLALDKATMSAKRTLADTLNGVLSSKFKEFVAESGSGEDLVVTSESERITTNLITETNLAGYTRTEAKVIPQGTAYRAYVLIQYPLGSANRVLIERIKKDKVLESKLRASKAFQDLEQEIQAARK